MKGQIVVGGLVLALVSAGRAEAQIGSIARGLQKARQTEQDLTISEEEEAQLGADLSARLREKYGVVQDRAVHTYVTLVGTLLAQASSRPTLRWTFIVLDTDGVNAFAAPGGYIHVTRGALALMQNEAELATVLGHEISHVTAKHTVRAIQKSKAVQAGANLTRSDVLREVTNHAYTMLLENQYYRDDEMEADRLGATLANRIGYAPGALPAFLTRLAERDKDLKDRSGIFASHPETVARIQALDALVKSSHLAADGLSAARFHASVAFAPVPVAAVAQAASPAAPAAAPEKAPSRGRFGLSGLAGLSGEKSSSQTVASAGSRGLNPDRDAKGGPNKAVVVVTVTPAELAAFRAGIVG